MRLRSMNEFTGKLPLVSKVLPEGEIGVSTATALQNGALRGALHEIVGIVSAFRHNHSHGKVLVCGGDMPFLRLLLAFCGFALSMTAQEVPAPTINSPFSRFGIGDPTPFAYSAQLGMGGVGQAFNHSHIASPSNPAALGALRYTSYQVGVGFDRTVLQQGAQENRNTSGQLQNLSLAFPLQNSLNEVLDGKESGFRHGMMLAIAPYSNIGYNVQVESNEAGLGDVVATYRGSGGYYRLQLGNGIELKKKLRLGLNLSYIFGRSNSVNQLLPADLTGASLLTDSDAFRGRGLEAQLGAQYDFVLERSDEGIRKRVLTIGASSVLGANVKGDASRTITRTNLFGALDTVSNVIAQEQIVELPTRLSFGAYYRVVNKFGVGVDVESVNWSGFNNPSGPSDNLENVLRVRGGLEWTPDAKAFGKFWKQVQYRAGGYINQDPRPGVDRETGLSFGLGFPIVKPREEISYVNLSLNAGSYNTTGDITQRYIRLVAGFTLTDNTWFYKRRFN